MERALQFGVFKPLNGAGSGVWLVEAEPFVSWGPQPNAVRFPTQAEAWKVIGRFSRDDGSGAVVVALE